MRSTLLTAIVLTIALSVAALGQGKHAKSEMKAATKTDGAIRGYVIDVMCGKDMGGQKDGMAKAAKHKRSCALEEGCASSGYGLLSDGKWYTFDEAGSKKAEDWIEATKQKDNLLVEVTGKADGNKFTLASIKEATDMKESKTPVKTESKTGSKKN